MRLGGFSKKTLIGNKKLDKLLWLFIGNFNFLKNFPRKIMQHIFFQGYIALKNIKWHCELIKS